jgi:hypothetical protein
MREYSSSKNPVFTEIKSMLIYRQGTNPSDPNYSLSNEHAAVNGMTRSPELILQDIGTNQAQLKPREV